MEEGLHEFPDGESMPSAGEQLLTLDECAFEENMPDRDPPSHPSSKLSTNSLDPAPEPQFNERENPAPSPEVSSDRVEPSAASHRGPPPEISTLPSVNAPASVLIVAPPAAAVLREPLSTLGSLQLSPSSSRAESQMADPQTRLVAPPLPIRGLRTHLSTRTSPQRDDESRMQPPSAVATLANPVLNNNSFALPIPTLDGSRRHTTLPQPPSNGGYDYDFL
jgi:hypothetical protein